MARSPTGTYPNTAGASGPYGTNICSYDAPITNATGYHYICFGANGPSGTTIVAGASGGASSLPLNFVLNGTTYQFPFTVSGVVGPATTVVGDFAVWNNTTGTLLKDVSQVTLAQLPNLAATSFYCNATGSPTIPTACTFGSTLAFSSAVLQTGAGTGDVTWSANSFVTTLATVNSNTGAFGSATACPTITVNAKGLVTAASSTTCSPTSFGAASGTSIVASAGLVSTGAYGDSYSNGTVVDYSSPAGRISVGAADTINFYNGGVANTLLAQITANGALSLTQGIIGTVAAGNATAGQVGEYISSSVASGGAQGLTTGANPVNVTSVSLTAGDWDCEGNVAFLITSTTNITQLYGWISTTTAALPTFPNSGGLAAWTAAAQVPGQVNGPILAIPRYRVNVSSTTSVYLSAEATFTASTNAAYGFIGCRRVR